MRIKIFIFVAVSIIIFNNCKAQDHMNNQITIILLDKESKEHSFVSIAFNTIFYWENHILYKKDIKTPFSGNIQVNYSNGSPNMELNYLNGKKDGKYLSYYPNGNLKEDVTFLNDEPIGISKYYYEDGIIYESIEYLTKTEEQETWKLIEYYSSGQKKEEGEKIKLGSNFVAPKYKIGYWIYYYENGKKKEEGNWQIGGMHGNDNIRVGEWKQYDKSGKLVRTVQFDNDGNQT